MKNRKIICTALLSVVMGSQLLPAANIFANELNTAKVSKENSAYPNQIEIRGRALDGHVYRGFNVGFDTSAMKIKVSGVKGENYSIHNLRPKKYTEFKLYDKDGNLKKSFSMTGKDVVSKARQFDNTPFKFGDFIEVYHIQHKNYVTGPIKNRSNENRNTYCITRDGLEQVKNFK